MSNFIDDLLLKYARNGWGEWARKSAFRKYRRRNSGTQMVATTTYGAKMEVVLGLDSVDDDIAVYGVMEPETAGLVHRLMASCDSMIDVGCNIGFYSCLFTQVKPGARIDSVDPNEQMTARTKRNLELNEASEFAVHTKGVSNEPGKLTLHIAKNRHSLSSFAFVPSRGGGAGKDVEVEVNRLMEIVSPEAHPAKVFLKIDTEGFEYNVLSGITRDEAGRFDYICFELSMENLRAAKVEPEKLFSVPWLEDFDAYVIVAETTVSPLKEEQGKLQLEDHDDVLLVRKGVDLPSDIKIS